MSSSVSSKPRTSHRRATEKVCITAVVSKKLLLEVPEGFLVKFQQLKSLAQVFFFFFFGQIVISAELYFNLTGTLCFVCVHAFFVFVFVYNMTQATMLLIQTECCLEASLHAFVSQTECEAASSKFTKSFLQADTQFPKKNWFLKFESGN